MSDETRDREDALDAVALVRMALTHRDSPLDVNEMLDSLIEDRSRVEVEGLLLSVADLAGILLEGWHNSIVAVTPSEAREDLLTPPQLLDTIVLTLVNGSPPEKE